MIFDSTIFLFFFLPITFLVYYFTPTRYKNIVLLLLSILFYAWGRPMHGLILIAAIVWNYIGGGILERNRKAGKASGALTILLVGADLLLLAACKYSGTFLHMAGFQLADNSLFFIPLGVSFYMLQNIAYIIDIYRGEARASKNIINYGLFIAMFPKLLAGPLVVYPEFERQIQKRKMTQKKIAEGLLRFVKGLAKRVILARAAQQLFETVMTLESGQTSVLSAWIGCISFALGIYFAFGGYCDMALGLGEMFGFELPENVNDPCVATGIMDFWSRWQATLWKWFCSYVYLPMCQGRPSGVLGFVSLVVTWILIGLWHGMKATFVIWGIYFAVFLYLEGFVMRSFLEKIPKLILWIGTSVVVLISWVFFFSSSVGDAASYLKLMIGVSGHGFVDARAISLFLNHGLLWVLALLASIPIVRKLAERIMGKTQKRMQQRIKRRKIAALGVFAILILGMLLSALPLGKSRRKHAVASLDTSVQTLLGKRQENGIYKGADHYLLEKIVPMDEELLKDNIAAIEEFDNSNYNIPSYLMLVPNAANLLSDKLPGEAVMEDQTRQFKEIKEMLDDSIQWINAQSVLEQHKKEEIYYRTDSRWTTLGAQYGFEALSSTMNLDTKNGPELKSYIVNNDFTGDLAKKSGYETGYEESIRIRIPKKSDDEVNVIVTNIETQKKSATMFRTANLEREDKYDLFLNGGKKVLDIQTTAESTDRLLVFKDSYANCLIPMMTPYFREIVVVDTETYDGNVQKLIANTKFTSILYLYNGNSFMKDKNLAKVLRTAEAGGNSEENGDATE